ncbi:MAG: hypothetical protein AMJ56_00100 [Anaerolineae bacterium SG8_19]|nr:MAG: hypothetical protein AMJ56_00100 [Anaerolineae bacterium SG8_19]
MRLKRLSLHGYKTFASRTTFEFNEGITAIVGPNGSGKSNIADAIRWVLGEQSFSTLRGKRTADMIFAGSQQRSRAGMAQAILTLDNSGGWLPIDYSEIEIGRRAYRSGENEYLLNGQKVRLKDVNELLGSSGLAQRTYTIIGQGLVDQALSLRADERRLLFEEAAGVSHYKMRRAETLRRLEETSHNLERIHDILTEIQPRLSNLKRQANRAKNYEQVAADLKHHLRILYGYKWEQAKKKIHQNRYDSEQAKQESENVHQELLTVQNDLQKKRQLVNEIQREVQEFERKRDLLRRDLEDCRREVAVLRERKSALEQQLEILDEEIPLLLEQKRGGRQELDLAVSDLRIAQDEVDKNQGLLSQYHESIRETQAQIDQRKNEVAEIETAIAHLKKNIAQTEGQISQLKLRWQETKSDQSNESDLARVEEEIEDHKIEHAKITAVLEKLELERNVLRERRSQLLTNLNQYRSEGDRKDLEVTKLRDDTSALQARCELLAQLLQKNAPLTDELVDLVRFIDEIRIPKTYRQAFEAALDQKLSTYLVPNEASLWILFDKNPELRLFSAVNNQTTVPDRLPTPDHPMVVDWAENLLDSESKIDDLGRLLLRQILIVKDRNAVYDVARSLPAGALVVSPDGLVGHSGGLFESVPETSRIKVLSQESEWRGAVAELEVKQKRLNSSTQSLESLHHQISAIQATIDETDAQEEEFLHQLQQQTTYLNDAQHALELALQKRDLLKDLRQSSQSEQERLLKQIDRLENSLIEDEIQLEKLQVKLEQDRQHLLSLPVNETDNQAHQLQQQIDTSTTILAGRQAVIDSRSTTLAQIDDLLNRRMARQQDLQTQLDELGLEQREDELQKLQSDMDEVRVLLRPVNENLANSRQQLITLEDRLDRLQRVSHEYETRYTEARIGLSQAENQMEALRDRIITDLGLVDLGYDHELPSQSPLPIAEVVEKLPEIKELPDDIVETIQRYRGQLTRMGGFNPDATVEYEETKQRYEYLVKQIDDLTNTQQKLRDIVDDLDIQTSRAFAETVEKVDKAFGDVFKRLFGGGSAQLVLTDPDELTLSGVDIVARLPRRREQGLALLSGGERSLTAAALIFALLKVSPTPFCVLDEVDAMLDEANVNRFRDILTELSHQTQFILITHNRGTVQVAESVYGVSMGADSVSQVVSIRPVDYVNEFEEASIV